MTQHASLSPERWSAFTLPDQILMIANEMNRALSLFGPGDGDRLRRAYERTLRLVDSTAWPFGRSFSFTRLQPGRSPCFPEPGTFPEPASGFGLTAWIDFLSTGDR